LNPYDAHAVAAAVELKEKLGGKVTIISMGPPAAVAAIRECIEMGADEGILISARQFSGADTYATSHVLAGVVKEIHSKEPIDMLFFGKQAIDGDTGQVGPGVAVRLGMPLVTYAVKVHSVNLEARTAVVERKTERWNELVEVNLPVVVACEKDIAEPAFASLPNLIHSLTYEPPVWTSESPINFEREKIGVSGSPTIVFKVGTPEKPAPGPVIQVKDMGTDEAVKHALEKLRTANVLSLG